MGVGLNRIEALEGSLVGDAADMYTLTCRSTLPLSGFTTPETQVIGSAQVIDLTYLPLLP